MWSGHFPRRTPPDQVRKRVKLNERLRRQRASCLKEQKKAAAAAAAMTPKAWLHHALVSLLCLVYVPRSTGAVESSVPEWSRDCVNGAINSGKLGCLTKFTVAWSNVALSCLLDHENWLLAGVRSEPLPKLSSSLIPNRSC